MMTTTAHNIIEDPLSPISPRGVSRVQHVEKESMMKLFPMIPAKRDSLKDHYEAHQEEQAQPHPSYGGSSAYYKTFYAVPGDLDIVIRTLAPMNPALAERAMTEMMHDILVNQMGLQQADEDVFVGALQGQRIVLARMASNQYSIFCADQDHANQFLALLRSFQAKVE